MNQLKRWKRQFWAEHKLESHYTGTCRKCHRDCYGTDEVPNIDHGICWECFDRQPYQTRQVEEPEGS